MTSSWEQSMGQSSGSYRQLSGADRQKSEAWERALAFLRQRHPVKTAAHVAAATGEQEDTVEKWFQRGSRPGGFGMLSLIAAYGAEFVVVLYGETAPGWVVSAARAAERTALEADLDRVRSRLTTLGGA
jgi:hypothetical protein